MGIKNWGKATVAVVLTAAPLAMPVHAAVAHSAAAPVVSQPYASPSPALSDADDVYVTATASDGSGCAVTSYQFAFGDGTVTNSTYAFAYHYYHVPSGQPPQTFTITVTATDSCGQSGSNSSPEVVDADTVPVANLTITHSSSNLYGINANASASTDQAPSSAYQFDFFWDDGTSQSTTAPTEVAYHRYTTAGTYTVTVEVFDYAGTSASTSALVTVPITQQPTAPSKVQAIAGNAQASVSWSAPTSGGTPTSYTITASPGPITQSAPGSASEATLTGLSNGKTYTFTVTAVTGGGSGPPSQPSNPITPVAPPSAPTSVIATLDDASAVVSWTPPSLSGTIPNSHHQGEKYIVNATPADVAATVVTGDPAPTNVTISGLKNGTSYTFTVIASNGVSGPASTASNAVIPQAIGPTITLAPQLKLPVPPATIGTSLNNLPLTLTLLWSGKKGTTAICSYHLQRSLNSGSWTDVALNPVTSTTATDTIPNTLETVRYQVQATDCAGLVSSWSQGSEFVYHLDEENNPKFAYTPSVDWARMTCSSCAARHDEVTTTAGATLTVTLTSAFNIGLLFAVGPTLGSAHVYTDGHPDPVYPTVDTYASTPGYRMLLFKTGWGIFGFHSIQVVVDGTAGHPGIDFDGAVVLFAPLAKLGT
jgi:Fibronectin type III domain/PKD domain